MDPHREEPMWATLEGVETALREDVYQMVAVRANFVEKPEALWLITAREP